MNFIKIELENCYGINFFKKEFDFSSVHKRTKERNNALVIYAPNGTMKTSFSKTLKDYSEEKISKDEIYPEKETKRIITKKNGNDLSPKEILVIESMNENFSPNVELLLGNKKLKLEYDGLMKVINENKKKLLFKLAESYQNNKTKDDLETIIKNDFKNNNFNEILEGILVDTENIEELTQIFNIKYKDIFNSGVEKFLASPEMRNLLSQYIKTYNNLFDESSLFKKGIFNHNNIGNIGENLKANKFFEVAGEIVLNGEVIKSYKELQKLIDDETKKILDDEELKSKFNKIDKEIKGKVGLSKFRELIATKIELLPKLLNYDDFRKILWKSYFLNSISELETYLTSYKECKDRLDKILDEISREKNLWDFAIDEFNARFKVPFSLYISNKSDVVLDSKIPSVGFKYENRIVEKDLLLKVLSGGERRALYLLNIIFELKKIETLNEHKLIIVDDIADSFDYKNKYAIVEYLYDLKKNKNINLIILTHNFDFYRTISSRLDIDRGQTLRATKNKISVELINGGYLNNLFTQWKKRVEKINEKYIIAAIPFVRNLAEYIEKDGEDYKTLTCLLHYKKNTEDITLEELMDVFSRIWRTEVVNLGEKGKLKVRKILSRVALESLENSELEDKLILSMEIRLLLEEFIIKSLEKEKNIIIDFTEITRNQTVELAQRYKKEFEFSDVFKIIDKVNIMTPENIHLNSFMYEPILDLSISHLYDLYSEVKDLSLDIEPKEIIETFIVSK